MKIVPSFDIGDLGPAEGAPVVYFWNPLYSVSGLLPWAFVAAGFAFFKENRNKTSLLILVPVFITSALWMVYCRIVTMSAAEKSQYDVVVASILGWFTLCCLLSSRLSRVHPLFKFIILIGLPCLVYGLHLWLTLGFHSEGLQWGIMYFVITLMTVIPAFVLARFFCRRKLVFAGFLSCYSAGAAVFAILSHLLVAYPYYLISYSYALPLSSFFKLSLETFLMCWSGSVPFLVLLFAAPFWRKRFESFFKITTRPAAKPAEKLQEQLPIVE
ncbi:MAG: hypothetical protein LLF76_12855 [Planctomycetaceae bacterium]|nr:hypothetical protein [Planctomycetaceae bacterium]